MAHPLIAKILDKAAPLAAELGLEVVGAVFYTNQRPPVLHVEIRNLDKDTGLEDCERMSRALDAQLDIMELIPDAYVLEVSSPGLSQFLSSDREFVSFKGFPVRVKTAEAYKGRTEWQGKLIRRDETTVYLNQKGRQFAIPRPMVVQVQLCEEEE
ncbi:MAG: ribosome maturation factor RimP [Microcoleaceae cyanobacterium]